MLTQLLFLSLQRKSTQILPNLHASRAVEGAEKRADDEEKNCLRPSLGPITQQKGAQERVRAFWSLWDGQKRRWDWQKSAHYEILRIPPSSG